MKFRFATALMLVVTTTFAQTDLGYQEAMFGTTPNAINKHLGNELRYPEEAQSKNIEGLTLFKFVVDTTGKIDSVINIYTPSFILSQEAVRVILLTDGKWTPAKRKNIQISCWHYLSVRFSIENGGSRKREVEEGNYYFNEGLEYYKNNQDADAINAFIIAQKMNSARADALYNVALIYQNSGDYDLACFYLNKIVDLKVKIDKKMMVNVLDDQKINCQ